MPSGGGGAGDWQCPNEQCINHTKMVFASKTTCPKCGASKDDPPMDMGFMGMGMDSMGMDGPRAEKGMQGGDMPDDWQCPNQTCINHTKMVFGKRTSCPSCGTARNATRPGDWQCPNQQCVNNRNTVFGSKLTCPKCGTPRPGGGGAPPARGGAMGPGPGALPGVAALQNMRHQLPPAVQGALNALPPQIQSLLGLADNGGCGGGGGGGGHGGQMGDWQCPNVQCMNNRKMVFAKNASCPKCGSAKPAPGKGGGGGKGKGGGGGTDPGDWECPNPECLNSRNKVFAKHSNCPKCGSEKPDDGFLRARSRSPYR
mmetsp:Transcript_4521/g.9090  ORF Transcript_4521/g.9090 Transcript_4521/m.9090 type:complete len:313 (-) Transcript_4521:77-1015(-)